MRVMTVPGTLFGTVVIIATHLVCFAIGLIDWKETLSNSFSMLMGLWMAYFMAIPMRKVDGCGDD